MVVEICSLDICPCLSLTLLCHMQRKGDVLPSHVFGSFQKKMPRQREPFIISVVANCSLCW